MSGLRFIKMVASGNDFVVMDSRGTEGKGYARQARILCERRRGVGADGLLILEDSKKADLRMRIFNADGSEAEMCGNGLRCTALHACKNQKGLRIETEAGIYEASVTAKDRVKIKMEEPKALKLDVPIKVNTRSLKVNYVDTGVPHAVIFVQGLEGIDVETIGRDIRCHDSFKPRGTNVDFVEIIDDKKIKNSLYLEGQGS
jgi:diaminopimelate epimerase